MADYPQTSFPELYAICVCVDIISRMPSVGVYPPFFMPSECDGWTFQILLEKFYLAVYFFCSNSTWKSVEKMVPFGRILVLAVYYFLLKFYLKKCWKIRFCSFWSNSGFGVALSPKNNINRATVNSTNRWHTAAYLFLALLFPWKSSLRISTRIILVLVVAFSFQNSTWKSVETLDFAAFGRILVLVVAFSFQNWSILGFGCCCFFKVYLKKCWKIKKSKLLVESWFWCCLFSQK